MGLEQEIIDKSFARKDEYFSKDCDLSNEENAQEFTYGFYDAQKAMERMMPLEIPIKMHLITITEECNNPQKASSDCSETSFILPYTLDTKVIREFEMGKRNYLLKHPDKKQPLKYDFRKIDDVFKIPGFDIDDFTTGFYDTVQGKKIKDVSYFDEKSISKRKPCDLDFDSFCLILRDKTVKIKDSDNLERNYLILETQCFDEDIGGRVDGCYSTIIVGELISFRREKGNGVEKIIASVKCVDKEQLSAVFECAKKCDFKGYVGVWNILREEIIPVEYSKMIQSYHGFE